MLLSEIYVVEYSVKTKKIGTYSDILLNVMYAVKDWVKSKELIQT